MKKILLLAFLTMPLTLLAQEIKQMKDSEKYCAVRLTKLRGSNEYIGEADFGEAFKNIKDSIGATVKFKSTIAGLNYFATRGWKLLSFYQDFGSRQVVYVFRRETQILIDIPKDALLTH